MDELGVDAVDEVRLAGAFGSQIDPLHAMVLGLVPDQLGDLARVAAEALQERGPGFCGRPQVGAGEEPARGMACPLRDPRLGAGIGGQLAGRVAAL